MSPLKACALAGAAAAAIEARPAGRTLRLGEQAVVLKAALHGGIKFFIEHAAHAEAWPPHELVARIDIAFRRHGHIFAARAAAFHALFHAGAVVEIHHKVEEIEPTTIPATLDVFRREPVVFREMVGNMSSVSA